MFDIDKILIGKIYTTLDSSIISSDSFYEEHEVICEPIRIAALYNNSDNESIYNEYRDILNDKFYMDEFFSTNKQMLFVNTKEKFVPLSIFFEMSNIKYNKKNISRDKLSLLLKNIFNIYNDKNFNFNRRILQRKKIIITDIKKTVFMLKLMPNELEKIIEILYENKLKIEEFKVLPDYYDLNFYFPNSISQEKVVAMVLSGENILIKLNKIGLNKNNIIYISSNIEEIKNDYNKFFNKKQKRI